MGWKVSLLDIRFLFLALRHILDIQSCHDVKRIRDLWLHANLISIWFVFWENIYLYVLLSYTEYTVYDGHGVWNKGSIRTRYAVRYDMSGCPLCTPIKCAHDVFVDGYCPLHATHYAIGGGGRARGRISRQAPSELTLMAALVVPLWYLCVAAAYTLVARHVDFRVGSVLLIPNVF